MYAMPPGEPTDQLRRPAPWRRRPLGLRARPRQVETFREHLRLGRTGLAIGIDICGTTVAAGVVDADGGSLT